MNICVVGAGAIGGWVAAKLALAGETVRALTSRGTLDRIEMNEGGGTTIAELGTFDGPADVLIVAVKATALAPAAHSARALVGPQTIIVPMLNGVPWWFVEGMPLKSVDADGSIAAALPFEQIVGCVVHASCSRSDGTVFVKHADKLIIGEPGGGETSERVARLFGSLDAAGLRPDLTGDVRHPVPRRYPGQAGHRQRLRSVHAGRRPGGNSAGRGRKQHPPRKPVRSNRALHRRHNVPDQGRQGRVP